MKRTLLVIGCILVALLGGCGGCAYLAYATMKGSYDETRPLVDRVQQQWNARDWPALHAFVGGSAGDLPAFTAAMTTIADAHGPITDVAFRGYHLRNQNGVVSADGVYAATHRDGSSSRLELTMRKDDVWRVVGFALRPGG